MVKSTKKVVDFGEKQSKNNKEMGITLMALVITIIVLLILAGVTIATLTGENGVITNAKKAQLETRASSILEERNIWLINRERAIQNGIQPQSMEDILTELKNKGLLTTSEVEKIQNDENNEIIIGSKTISFYIFNTDKLKIGDYVNYKYDVAENYIITEEECGLPYNPADGIPQTIGLKWKILNIDEDMQTIDLISANSTNDKVYLRWHAAYNNGVYLLNDICVKQYSNKKLGIVARSINLEDFEKHLTPDGFEARNNYKNKIKYGTSREYIGKYNYPKTYIGKIGAGVDTTNIIQPNINNTINPYKENSYTQISDGNNTQTTDSVLTATQTYYNLLIDNSIFGVVAPILNEGSGYWVATTCVDIQDEKPIFGIRRVLSNRIEGYVYPYDMGKNSGAYVCIRPVVSLPLSLFDGTKDENNAWNLIIK